MSSFSVDLRSDPQERSGPALGPNEVLVELIELRKDYDAPGGLVEALSPTSLDLGRGEFICVVGPSGCGKTTLLTLISGLMRPTGGEVRIEGQVVRGPYRDLGIVFQSPVLLDWRTTLDNVLLQIEMRNLKKSAYRSRAIALLHALGLDGFTQAYPSQLSGGMRQRASIARALIHDPPLLLMDEPFAAVDALTRDQLTLDLQYLWLSRENTVFFITHNVEEAVFLADRIVVMTPRPGRIARIITVGLPRPRRLRDRASPKFTEHVSAIREIFLETGVLREEPLDVFTQGGQR